MNTNKHELAKLGLAFAVGVSLSAGYVALGAGDRGDEPAVVVVREQCDEHEGDAAAETGEADHGPLALADLPGDAALPEGLALHVDRRAMWIETGDRRRVLAQLDDGRLRPADVRRGQVSSLESALVDADGVTTAVLWIDHRVPGATLADVLATLERAGVTTVALAVEGVGDGPRAYRFTPNFRGDAGDDDGPWALGLSLRLTERGGATAWVRPTIASQPRSGGPSEHPLDIGDPTGTGQVCALSTAERPDPATVADLERQLCALNRADRDAPLGVEFVLARGRTVGEFLALRATDGREGECRGPTFIAGAYAAPADECAAAIGPEAALDRFAGGPRPSRTAPVEAGVDGWLDKDAIRQVVRENIAAVRSCYNDALRDDPTLAGRVVIRAVIDGDGSVGHTEVAEGTSIGHPKVARCIADAMASWQFPASKSGTTIVTYPFVLSPG